MLPLKDLRLVADPAPGSEVYLVCLVELHQGTLSRRAVRAFHQRIVNDSQ